MENITNTVKAISQIYPVKGYVADQPAIVTDFCIHPQLGTLKALFIPAKVVDDDLAEHCKKKANIIHIYLKGNNCYMVPYLMNMTESHKLIGTLLCPPSTAVAEQVMLIAAGMSDSIISDEGALSLSTRVMLTTEYIETYCIPLDPHPPTYININI